MVFLVISKSLGRETNNTQENISNFSEYILTRYSEALLPLVSTLDGGDRDLPESCALRPIIAFPPCEDDVLTWDIQISSHAIWTRLTDFS